MSKRRLFDTPAKRVHQGRQETEHAARSAFERSRPAADASREVVERWFFDGLDISVGHRRCCRDPSSQNDAGRTAGVVIMHKIPYATSFVQWKILLDASAVLPIA